MILKKIEVFHFRNFVKSTFNFDRFLTVIIGKNSVGKTNLLESIYFVLKGRGFREEKQVELIKSQSLSAEVRGEFIEDNEKNIYRIILKEEENSEKSFFINKLKKGMGEYLKNVTPVATFSPSFIYVIDGTPGERRSYFDVIISSYDFEYKKRLVNYENGLRKRNKVLEIYKDMIKLKEELFFWDEYLIKEAYYLNEKRQEFCDFLNKHKKIDNKVFSLNYLPNKINHDSLAKTFQHQLYVRKTLVGPQRDIFEIYLAKESKDINVHKYGSRSEERLALFWIVINEINLYADKLKKRPIVLLDDIFSELDIDNKTLVLKLIKKYQAVVTTTEKEVLSLIDDIPHTIINL